MVVPVAVDDPAPGGVDVVEVLADVGDEVGRLPLAQAAPVAPQVDGVEVVAALDPPVGVLLVEEVVVEAVHVEHGLGGRLLSPPLYEGGDDRPLLVLGEVDGLRGVGRPKDLVDLAGRIGSGHEASLPRFVLKHAQPQFRAVPERAGWSATDLLDRRCVRACSRHADGPSLTARRRQQALTHRRLAAAATRAMKSAWSRFISGCHWTPTQKRSPTASMASTVSSGAHAVASKPGCERTDWWW